MPRGYVFDAPRARRIAENVRWGEAERKRLRGGSRQPVITPDWESFQNDQSAITAPAYGLMEVVGDVTDDGDKYPRVRRPASTLQALYLVNDAEEVEYQAFNRCWYPGRAVRVVYDTGTPAFGEVWGLKSGQWTASRNGVPMFTVIAVIDATAKVMQAYFELPRSLLGKNVTGSSIAAGNSGTITIYTGAAGAEASSGFTVTGFNRTSESIANNAWVGLTRIQDTWYAVPLTCA